MKYRKENIIKYYQMADTPTKKIPTLAVCSDALLNKCLNLK